MHTLATIAALAATTAASAAPTLLQRHALSHLPDTAAATAPESRQAPAQHTLNQPLGLALDKAGNLYVANLNTGITIYDTSHKLIGQFSAGTSVPTAVAVTSFGNILVANGGTRNITVFNPSHAQIATYDDGAIAFPFGMVVDGNDAAYLIDNAGTLHLFLPDGRPGGTLGTGGTAVGPWNSNWAVWGVPVQGGYNEFVENTGDALHNGLSEEAEAGFAPMAGGEAEDAQGNQYVTDQANNRIMFYTADGAGYLPAFTTPSAPYGIAIDPIRGRIYVSFPQTDTVGIYALAGSHKLLATIH